MKEIHLSNECWKLWVSVTWTVFIIVFLAVIAVSILVTAASFDAKTMVVVGTIIAGLIFVCLLLIAYLRSYWKRFSIAYDENQLRVSSGVWWRKQVLIPLVQITNIGIVQGPWQRARKLATLKVETAGRSGTSNPETQIWSLADYESIRDKLLQPLIGARSSNRGDLK